MSSSEDKADPDVKRDMQLAAFRYDLSTARSQDDIVKFYLQARVDPKYIAQRYGIDVARCERYAAALKKQEDEKRERETHRTSAQA